MPRGARDSYLASTILEVVALRPSVIRAKYTPAATA